MHVVITFPRMVQRHSTCKMKLKILSQKSQNFFLCCKFARVIIKREGGPKSFCPTCQELSKNLLQFFSLSSFYLAKAGGSRKKFSSNSWCPQKLGRKAKNRLKLASQSFDLMQKICIRYVVSLMDDIIFCTQSTLTLVPKVWNFVTFDYCIFPSWKAFFLTVQNAKLQIVVSYVTLFYNTRKKVVSLDVWFTLDLEDPEQELGSLQLWI